MRILLINPSAEGERHSYASPLAKAFSELGHEVFLLSQNANNQGKIAQSISTNTNKHKYIFGLKFELYRYLKMLWQDRQEALKKWQQLFDHINYLKKESNIPDLLFFESLDSTLGHFITNRHFGNRFDLPFSGLLVCPEDPRLMTKSFLRKGPLDHYNLLKSKFCISIGVVVEESIPFLSRLIHKPVILIPDIVNIPEKIYDNSLGHLIKKQAGERFIIGLWGSISHRKGISDFLQMSLNLPLEIFFLVMGGKINPEGLSHSDKEILLKGLSGDIENMLIADRWLSDDELLSGMGSCDLIFAAYPYWRYSSGIIGHAAGVKTPILVNDGFVMANRVNDYNIGFIKQNQVDTSMWVSDNIIAIKKLHNSSSFKERCSRYCEKYSFEQWCKSLALLIELEK